MTPGHQHIQKHQIRPRIRPDREDRRHQGLTLAAPLAGEHLKLRVGRAVAAALCSTQSTQLPMLILSPTASRFLAIRLPLWKVPLVLPRSLSHACRPLR
jgi:hypothetical protein